MSELSFNSSSTACTFSKVSHPKSYQCGTSPSNTSIKLKNYLRKEMLAMSLNDVSPPQIIQILLQPQLKQVPLK
jgi:hypothetical protein